MLSALLDGGARCNAQFGIWTQVGQITSGLAGISGAVTKAAIHGVVRGAIAAAQGGDFLQGFAGSAIGAIGGAIASGSGLAGTYGDGVFENQIARAAISGAAGCVGALATGGKCAAADV